MGYTRKNPNADVPEGKRVPGRTAEEREADYEMVIPSNVDEGLNFVVKLPKRKLDQAPPQNVPAEPE